MLSLLTKRKVREVKHSSNIIVVVYFWHFPSTLCFQTSRKVLFKSNSPLNWVEHREIWISSEYAGSTLRVLWAFVWVSDCFVPRTLTRIPSPDLLLPMLDTTMLHRTDCKKMGYRAHDYDRRNGSVFPRWDQRSQNTNARQLQHSYARGLSKSPSIFTS